MRMPVLDAGLPAHISIHKSGGRDQWSEPMAEAPVDLHEGVIECLREVLDPEIPISLVDLGLIYGVAIKGHDVTIDLSFTATACPCMEFIKEDIRDRLEQENWISSVRIDEVWDPPWTTDRITPQGRALLKKLGVGAA